MHFKSIFGYVVGISITILAYVVAVTFLNIPEKNARFVDIAFGFLLNIFGNSAAYLIGGNPANSKKNDERTIEAPKSGNLNSDKGEQVS